MQVLLASSSPRRRELLTRLGVSYRLVPGAELDEEGVLAELEGDLAVRLKRLAQLKGDDAAQAHPDDVVISADTVVEVDGELLGKPLDRDDARRMLTMLSGRAHNVISAVVVQRAREGFLASGAETTRVNFRQLEPALIEGYLDREEPYDKAGAYGIQGVGALLVAGIEGDYTNVVGLPLGLTAALLKQAGVSVI